MLLLLNDGLDGVAQELADDVFQVVENVGEGSIEMTFEFDFGEDSGGPVGGSREGLDLFPAAGDDFLGIAFEKYFSYKLGLRGLRDRKVPG